MTTTKAYNEMTGLLLSREEQEKFEWSIGCMLDDGPCHPIVFLGAPGTGKTTLMTIIRKVLLSPFAGSYAPRVAFLSWGDPKTPRMEDGVYSFVETLDAHPIIEGSLVIETSGRLVPAHKYYVLMREIDSELPSIADKCISLFRERGEGYFTFEENDR